MQISRSTRRAAFVASLTACALSALPALSAAQTQTNSGALYNIQRNHLNTVYWNRILGEQRARAAGMATRGHTADGRYFQVVGQENGRPVYFITDNIKSADTISSDDVWPGGSAGLSLNGNNVSMGVWDGGHVRSTHQEFAGGRVTFGDTAPVQDHGTHVGGTMVAAGVNPNAKGMSFGGKLKSYDWNSDTAEMAAAAASGMLVSNHSYGQITGWNFMGDWYWHGNVSHSPNQDSNFGRYDNAARDWDDICYNAPYYLPVKSSGNDRGEGPALADQPTGFYWNGFEWAENDVVRDLDGSAEGYDSISLYGIAKNIMTVGAVTSITGGWSGAGSVNMSDFSCWGPSDDGRIKPDLVASGVGLFSTTSGSDNSYGSSTGTSMATPSVSGSLGLLQQHYRDTHSGEYMRAATLKGLAIHTASEAGAADGPDYRFGWGLMNTRRAAQIISNDVSSPDAITEGNLLNGQTFTYAVEAMGGEPLKVTICWTDPKGVPAPAANNSTKLMLVNDLDLRITSSNGTEMPWVLNPAAPSAAATKGDNFRDNVEQVVIPNPVGGATYTISVTHKNSLTNGGQAFSMILSGGAGAAGGSITVDSISTAMGTFLGGNVASVETSDNSYYTVRSELINRVGQYAAAEIEFDNPAGKSNSLNASIEAIAQGGERVTGSVFFYNYSTGAWDFIRSYNLPSIGDQAIVTRITRNGANYVSNNNKVRLMFRTHEPIRTFLGYPRTHTLRIDKVTLN